MGRPTTNNYTFYKFVNVNNSVQMYYVGSTANMKSKCYYYRQNIHNPTNSTYNSKLFTTIREYGGIKEFVIVELGKAYNITLPQSRLIEDEYRNKLKIEIDTCLYVNPQEELERHKIQQITEYIEGEAPFDTPTEEYIFI